MGEGPTHETPKSTASSREASPGRSTRWFPKWWKQDTIKLEDIEGYNMLLIIGLGFRQ